MTTENKALQTLHNARHVIILAGAGMSAELGIPTYYKGEHTRYGDEKSLFGYSAFEHVQEYLWSTDPKSQMKYFNHSWKELLAVDTTTDASPYQRLLNFLREQDKEYFVATTNVDSAFPRTGFKDTNLFEVHGSYRLSQCLDHPNHGIFPTENPSDGYTVCPICHGSSRPNTLFFMDFYFNPDFIALQQDRFVQYINEIKAEDTVVLEIGAGETVNTLRSLSHQLKEVYNFPVVRINPDNSFTNDSVEITLKMKTGEAFDILEIGK